MHREETISFPFHGEQVTWTYTEIDTSAFAREFRDLHAMVKCSHPIFIRLAHGSRLFITSLTSILDRGRTINQEFFDGMAKSFMEQHYAVS